MNLEEKFDQIEKKIREVEKDRNKYETEKEVLRREIEKAKNNLKELGVSFTTKEELLEIKNQTELRLDEALSSLERKLKEFEEIKIKIDLEVK